MRGVLLAGGEGTRLRHLTGGSNKHLLRVGGVPMILHPLRRLVEAGVQEILVVSSPSGTAELARVLGGGAEHGCELTYRVQDRPGGIAHALSLAESFAAGEPIVVVLGDNVFEGPLSPHLDAYRATPSGALVLLKRVPDPHRYGVARFEAGRIAAIVEKPAVPPTDYAVTGIYVYDARFAELTRALRASARGELEVTDLNTCYLERGELRWRELGGAWIDAGTPESYREAERIFGEAGR